MHSTRKTVSAVRRTVRALLLGVAVFAAVPCALVQVGQAAGQAGQAATQALLDRAHTAEVRGRMDMAAQDWQQVLLADPNNTEALGGLARAAKLSGDSVGATNYINRLRAINPNDPAIARAEALQKQQDHNVQLTQAGKLAQSGQYAKAMDIFRQVYGDQPPPGDAALAYYETEAATEDGRPHAIAGLRSLMDRFPSDSRYQIQLGKILTYNPRTRAEGRDLLSRHPADPEAQEALRQSLLWDSQNPATAEDIRRYLAKHPNDTQLATALARMPKVTVRKPTVPLTPEQEQAQAAERERSAEDQAGYRALNAKNLADAEAHFKESLARSPDDASALAGMGYIRMQQANFGGAISYLAQAKQDGATDKGLDAALATSHFWYTMGEGAAALKENDLPEAEKQYRTALDMRPNSPEALEALGGTLMQAQQFDSAEPIFAAFVRVKPSAPSAWRGLFMAQYQSGKGALAIQTDHRMPPGVHAQLMRDPLYLRTLASAYSSVGRDADAQRVLHSALELPFPPNAKGIQVDTQLQYAALLQAANHIDQASGLYRQAVQTDPSNANAWKGLVGAEHAQAQDQIALQTIESMPPTVYDAAMGDPGFEQTVASIYQSQNKYDIAQDLLEKALAQQTTAGQKPAIGAQLQLAGIYVQRGNTQQAYPIYQRILTADPSRVDAWKGLLTTLHSTGRDQEALAQIQQIPPQIRVQLETDVNYLQTVGSVYAALNDPRDSQRFLMLIQQHYAAQHAAPPADIDIQDAWLLFNGGNDAGLYRELMQLGGRPDLTDAQRRTVQTIWANWAVRRANQAAAANHMARSIEILNAAAAAFPDNPGVSKALAGGYAKVGNYKGALTIWKAQDMSSASASDYKGAVGVALAAGDSKDAETWLRFGLNAYPKDAQLLILGAKFEQARGDSTRAAEYYRASLTAMPPPDPGAELAYALSHYVPSATAPLPSAKQAKSLSQLLQPGINDAAPSADEPTQVVDARPYLPSYNGSGTYSNVPVPVPAAQNSNGYYAPNGSNVVPSYMSNPNPAQAAPAQPRTSYSLKDYVPQASVSEPLPADATTVPTSQFVASYYPPVPVPARRTQRPAADSYSPAQSLPPTQPTEAYLSPDEYQRQQIVLATQKAEAAEGFANPYPGTILAQHGAPPPLRPGTLTQNPTSAQPGSYQSVPQQPNTPPALDEYGHPYTTYVPYVPTSTPTSYQVQEAVPVNLGATPPVVPTADPTLTDVLPVAKNVPNAHSRRLGTQHPDIAAANAAAIRRNQSNPRMSGISVPPPEEDNTPPTQNTQYNASGQMNQSQTHIQTQNQTSTLPQSSSYQGTADQTPTPGQQYPQPNLTPTRGRSRARTTTKTTTTATTQATTPASGLIYPSVPQPLGYQPYPAAAPAFQLPAAPTDADLVAKKVPPLRNNYDVLAPTEPGLPLSERDQTERDLAALEAAYSGWIGGTGIGRYRSGRTGLDRLTDLEASFEASGVLGHSVRATIVPTAVFLSNGTANMADYTGSGTVLGTYQLDPDQNPNGTGPAAQYATGVGGELQLTSNHIDVALGYTPYQFLVNNVTGRVAVRLFKHMSLFAGRDAVKETQLSYAGLRDPGTVTPIYSGNIWGGVVQTGGGFRFDFGNERSGFYFTADGADLTGYHVLENTKAEGSMGAYFLVKTWPGIGKLNIGAAMFGEHYSNNQIGQTYGVGGYFSPEAYFLAAVPVTFSGTYKHNFHYNVAGSVGVQTFEEDNALFFPLDRALQTSFSSSSNCTLTGLANHTTACAQYPVVSNTGLNYGLTSEGSYRISDHWFVGGYLNGNNTNNYNTISGGFFVRYLFRQQYPVEDTPTGMFPYDGFRPLRVP